MCIICECEKEGKFFENYNFPNNQLVIWNCPLITKISKNNTATLISCRNCPNLHLIELGNQVDSLYVKKCPLLQRIEFTEQSSLRTLLLYNCPLFIALPLFPILQTLQCKNYYHNGSDTDQYSYLKRNNPFLYIPHKFRRSRYSNTSTRIGLRLKELIRNKRRKTLERLIKSSTDMIHSNLPPLLIQKGIIPFLV